jgi:hypothetical protein
MRLVRLVVAGIVLGAVGGYAAALLRPRTVHRNPAVELTGLDLPPLPERDDHAGLAELDPAEVRR